MAETVEVIQGTVSLNTQPFLTALKEIAAAVTSTVAKVNGTLSTIGSNINADIAASAAAEIGQQFAIAGGATRGLSRDLSNLGSELSSLGSDLSTFLSSAGTNMAGFITEIGTIGKGVPSTAAGDIEHVFSEISTAVTKGITDTRTTLAVDWAAFTADIRADFTALGTTVQTEIGQWGTTLSTLGTAAHDAITAGLTAFTLAWGVLSGEIGSAFSTAGTALQGDIAGWGATLAHLGTAAQDALQAAWLAFAQRWDQLTADVGSLFTGLGTLISTDIAAVAATLATLGTAAETSLQTAWQAISTRWAQLTSDVAGIFAALGLAVQADIAAIGATVTTLGTTVETALGSAWATASARFGQWTNQAATAMGSIQTAITSAIAGFTSAIEDAFTSALGAVAAWLQNDDPFAGVMSAVQSKISALQGLIASIPGLQAQASSAAAPATSQDPSTIKNPVISGWTNGAPIYAPAPIPGFAGGTDSAPGGTAWVGEDGPELVTLPRGAQVTPATRAAGIVSASLSETLGLVSALTQDIARSITTGLSELSATIRAASTTPTAIHRTTHINVDNMYVNADGSPSATIEQLRLMGGM